MSFYKRTFQIDDQWNVVHLPEKPNGFAILIIGDTNHYVDEKTSLWEERGHRRNLLYTCLKAGYTVFYSNLFGSHWGNDDSESLAKKLIHFVLSRETLNSGIHLLAEGMGALTGLALMEDDTVEIRSAALMNPCLDLNRYLKDVSETKWFYKRLLHQIAKAYKVPVPRVHSLMENKKALTDYNAEVPVKIWHATARTVYPFYIHSRPYAQNREKIGSPISLLLHIPEKQFGYGEAICSFFRKYEKVL